MVDPFANDQSVNIQSSRYQRRLMPRAKYGLCHSSSILSSAWVIFGLLAVLIPLIYRTIHKNKYRDIYMSYYWEQEYQYYEQQRQQLYETYGNNYNYGGAYMYADYAERDYVDVNNCQWWQINCFSFYTNQDGQPMPDQQWMPSWYSGFSLTEEERMEMDDSLEQPGSLKFVYMWQLVMFFIICWYGMLVIRQNRNPTGLMIALIVWLNFAFLSMWLMADGSIVTDGQQVKRTGFYGQISVLIFMSNFWYFLHGLIFLIVFWIRASFLAEQKQSEKEEKQVTSHH